MAKTEQWLTRSQAETIKEDDFFLGTLKWYDENKGFGFIEGPDSESDIFLFWREKEDAGFALAAFNEGIPIAAKIKRDQKGLRAKKIWRIK